MTALTLARVRCAHLPRSILQRSTTCPSRTTWYSSKCATVRQEWFGTSSSCSPTGNRPSTAAADSPRIRPCSCNRVATDRKDTRLNSSHGYISYAVFCLKKKNYAPPLSETVALDDP